MTCYNGITMENTTDKIPVPEIRGAAAPAPVPEPVPAPAPTLIPPTKDPKEPKETQPIVVSDNGYKLLAEKLLEQQVQIASLQASVEQLTKSLADVATGRHRSQARAF